MKSPNKKSVPGGSWADLEGQQLRVGRSFASACLLKIFSSLCMSWLWTICLPQIGFCLEVSIIVPLLPRHLSNDFRCSVLAQPDPHSNLAPLKPTALTFCSRSCLRPPHPRLLCCQCRCAWRHDTAGPTGPTTKWRNALRSWLDTGATHTAPFLQLAHSVAIQTNVCSFNVFFFHFEIN